MFSIEKVTISQTCYHCDQPATVKINDMALCPKCGDDLLIKAMVKASKALQQVEVKLILKVIDTNNKMEFEHKIQKKQKKQTSSNGRSNRRL